MDKKESFVVFKHENEEFILQSDQMVLNRYHCNFSGERIVDFQTKSRHCHVKMLFEFLRNGTVPDEFEDQIQVFELLKEWDCYFLVIDSFRFRIQSERKNGFVSHKGILYPVNIGSLFFQSSAYQEYCFSNFNEVFIIDEVFSSKSVEVLLDLIHCRIKHPEIEYIDEVIELCSFLGCSCLKTLINDNSAETILSAILRKQEEESFDFSKYESFIVANLEYYLSLSDFSRIYLPFLVSVFQKTQCDFSVSLLQRFFERCIRYHGSQACIILSKIRFEGTINVEELNQFFDIFLENNSKDFFSLHIHHFKDLSKRFEEGEMTICEMKSIINDFKMRQIQQEKIIEGLESEIKMKTVENNKTIEDLIEQMKKKDRDDQKRIADFKDQIEKIEKDYHKKFNDLNEKMEKKVRGDQKHIEELNEQMKQKERKDQKQIEELKNHIDVLKTINDFEDNIFEAAAKGNITSIIYLLANGTKVNEKYQKDKYDTWFMKNATPLHFSSLFGHISVVEYLIKHKADPNAKRGGVDIAHLMKLHSI